MFLGEVVLIIFAYLIFPFNLVSVMILVMLVASQWFMAKGIVPLLMCITKIIYLFFIIMLTTHLL